MSTIKDYEGRTVDVLALQGEYLPFSQQAELLVQALATPRDGGKIVGGAQKLAQRTLMVLLTKLGSRQYEPLAGTGFMIDAQYGLWRTPADVSLSFYSARLDVSRQVQAIETDDDPDDERWGSLELTGLTLQGGNVTLRLTQTSRAGFTAHYLTPITVTVQ